MISDEELEAMDERAGEDRVLEDIRALITEVRRLRYEPPLAQHAIAELNAAHKVLDELGAPKTRTVPARDSAAWQEITIGVRDRILRLMGR
jgi:hypothetical protein